MPKHAENGEQREAGAHSRNGSEDSIPKKRKRTEADGDTSERAPAAISEFKQWAQRMRNDALGFAPSTAPVVDKALRAQFKPRQVSPDPMIKTLDTSKLARPKHALTIERSEEIQKIRSALPVVQEEQRIMEAVHNNPVVIVCGQTGSGKSTQLPQMLYESGYGSQCGTNGPASQSRGMIGVTQPRRVAAVSVANRVASELGDAYKAKVAHQVRYDSTSSAQTAIKFMTDGILLRELHNDFILSKYSAIVIDEAHERSINTDILIGTLSRIVDLRQDLTQEDPSQYYPLKLVIMSATLRVTDFAQNQRLFRGMAPPIIEAEGRQYPVTIHFARRTQRDYIEDIVRKVSRGHRKLPPGGMLVFLTGQNEINTAAVLLKKAFGDTSGTAHSSKARESADQVPLEIDDIDVGGRNDSIDEVSDIDSDGPHGPAEEDFDLGEDEPTISRLGAHSRHAHILPLYAALPTSQQMRIFEPPPPDSRLIVLATNVAETSLTIPGIRYVFDCGRSKEKRYDQKTGVQTFEIDWISKASAAQRTGRAGRTGPGHCWRLYSSAIYEEFFAEHSLPEILRSPIEGTILQLKAMNVDNVTNFPFPTPPDRSQLQAAEMLLRNLGALETGGKITVHGRALMQYPVSPRFGKMLKIAATNGVLDHAIALVAGLAVGDLYLPELQSDAHQDDDSRSTNLLSAGQQRHQEYTRAQALLSRWDDRSDSVKLLVAVAVHADAVDASKTCKELFLREKGMTEVQQLRQQLHAIVRSQQRQATFQFKLSLPLASEKERKMLNQIVAASYLDQIAIRADMLAVGVTRKPRSAIEVPYRPLFPLAVDRNVSAEEQEEQKNVYVHPGSVLARLSKTEMPNYVVYSHLSKASSNTVGAETTAKTRMHPLATIGAKALAVLAQDTPLLVFGKPIGKIEQKDRNTRECSITVTLSGVPTVEWPLGAWKVEQHRDKKGDWILTKVLAR